MLLRLEGIRKGYPGVVALDGVDLALAAGEVHAVLGENGAGKSTLVGVAAGSVHPDAGEIDLAGTVLGDVTPAVSRRHGLAIVHQTPALAPSLTVTESLLMVTPPGSRPRRSAATGWAGEHLARHGLSIDPRAAIGGLSLREAHLIEIVAALIGDPKILILDEPTEALGQDETAWLFERVAELKARGAGILYITHRIPEVRAIADRMTILRDGRTVGTFPVGELTEDEIVTLIVGRSLDTAFPPKAATRPDGPDGDAVRPAEPAREASPGGLTVSGLAGDGFSPIDLDLPAGRITGLAGIEGHGQRAFLRALAGVEPSTGGYRVAGREAADRSPAGLRAAGVVYLPGDRLAEAVFPQLSVRENVDVLDLPRLVLARRGPGRHVLSPARERAAVADVVTRLNVRTPSLETPVTSLSGGNQQKTVLARAALVAPRVLLVEDPTQGVDAGARVEIYRILRELADRGTAVVVLSTDAVELAGLCDRVVVFSRGRLVAGFDGDRVSEEAITGAALRASHHRDASGTAPRGGRRRLSPGSETVPRAARRGLWPGSETVRGAGRRRLSAGGVSTIGVLAATALVAAGTTLANPAFLSLRSVSVLLLAATSLILVSLGQLTIVISGGIDLSMGSVVALSVVTFSFFAPSAPGAGTGLGVLAALAVAAAVGAVNAALVLALRMPPVVATLVSGVAVAGVALVLRPTPGGQADMGVLALFSATLAGIPVFFLAALLLAAVAEWTLVRARPGMALRAVGADPVKAHRMGVPVRRTLALAYVGGALSAGLAGLALFGQTGVGDATVGQVLTLTGITAVVLGGASIFGGSGSYPAVAAAALFLQTVTSALTFLDISIAWQYWLPGLLVLAAGTAYALRARGTAASTKVM